MKCKIISTLTSAIILSGCSTMVEQPSDRLDIEETCYSSDSIILMGKDVVLVKENQDYFSIKKLDLLKDQNILSYNHFKLNSKGFFNYDEQSFYLSVSSGEEFGWIKDTDLKRIVKYRSMSDDLDERESQIREWMCRP